MAKMTTDELLGVFEEMTVLELKEFLDAFEEKFDVTAAAPVAVAAAPAGGGDDVGAGEEKEEAKEPGIIPTGPAWNPIFQWPKADPPKMAGRRARACYFGAPWWGRI